MSAQPYSRADRKRAYPRCRNGRDAWVSFLFGRSRVHKRGLGAAPAGFVAGGSFSIPMPADAPDRVAVFYAAASPELTAL